MAEFMKIFRRQKSQKKENTGEDLSHVDPQHDLNLISRNSSTCDVTVSSELNSNNLSRYSMASVDKPDEGFKEPKGWRKSLRKLKWKKREPSVSASSDNIAKIQNDAVDSTNKQSNHTPTKLSKRWSYSPDLCEDNVPGARELRGTLERKLSVKHEMDEHQSETPHRGGRYKYRVNSSLSSKRQNETYVDVCDQPNEANFGIFSHENVNDKTYVNVDHVAKFQEPFCSSGNNKSDGELHVSQNIGHSNAKNNTNGELSKSEQLSSSADWSSEELEKETYITYPDDEITPGSTTEQSCFSDIPMTSSTPTSADTGTPEEEDLPYDLEDIDEVLGEMDSRASTLKDLHGQAEVYNQLNRENNPIHALTGSLMRGRTGTKFERDAELVLENLEYGNYNDAPVDHYYKHLNDINDNQNLRHSDTPDTDEGTYEEYEVRAGEDNISWDSNEFDSYSDDSDEENRHEKSLHKELKQERKSSKDLSKEVQKFKFWERASIKKKVSVSKAPEPEPSLFVDFNIPLERQLLPQLPTLIPPCLSENQLKRRRIVGTILSSEQSYIESLQRLETDYRQALLDSKPLIVSSDVVEKIFYKISAILQCHRLFQMALAYSTQNWDSEEMIGATFISSFSNSMVLECYGDFINNFTNAMDTVRKTCIRKPQFLAFLRERQTESKDRLNLYGLMLKPVQRFPQFIMLVQDLLKHTPPHHKDRLQLQLALTELETLADRLNRRKAWDEDASDLRNLIENSNLKLGHQTKDGKTRRLLKQGDVRECELNEDGLLEKVKDCLLVLTNDMLICCSISARRPHQRSNSTTYKDMYKLKWRVGLDAVEVNDGSTARHSNRIERESLHSDFITLQQINRLIDRLQLPHEGVSTQIIDKCISDLETRIRQAEQLATQPEDASFTVKFPGKSSAVSRTLVLSYNSQKDEWLEAISRAKLANASSNLDCWYDTDMSGNELSWQPPLFLRSLSAHMSFETLQVQCAYSFMPTYHSTLLWLSCAASTVLAVVSVYYITEDRVEKVHVMQVESSVQCMEHWKPFDGYYSVWLGMESGCLLEYSADGSYRKLSDVAMPTMSTVMIMKAHRNNLYVGLLDGTLAMYNRPRDTMDLQHVSSIVVGTGPLACLSPVEDKLWGCSGNSVVTIDMEEFKTESSRSLLMEDESYTVNLVAQVGSGVWVSYSNECILHLYHLESLQRLQELALGRMVKDFVQESSDRISEECHITSLWSAHCLLFVGTSNGLLITMPLPKLPGSVPKTTGLPKICRHSLIGPVTFLFAPPLPRQVKGDKTTSRISVLGAADPPPLPRRDDLDKTVINDSEDESNTSESQKNVYVSPTSSTTHWSVNNRETPPIPYAKHSSVSPLSISRPDTPPSRPPTMLYEDVFVNPLRQLSCQSLTENGSLYENMELHSIESPRKLTFINWDEKTSRQCLVVLACGEGYRKINPKATKQPANNLSTDNHSPTILCWKVVTS